MMEPSLTLKFLICSLNKRGYFNCNDRYLLYGVITGTVIELVEANCLEVWDKHAKVIGSLPEGKKWLEPVYSVLANGGLDVTLSDVATRLFIPVLTDAKARATLEHYWPFLEENGYIERRASLLGKYTHKIANVQYFEGLKSTLKNQLLGDCPRDAETLTLLYLLKHSQCIQNVIPGVSKGEIKERFAAFEDGLGLEPPVKDRLDENRNLISCVSFATSAMNGIF